MIRFSTVMLSLTTIVGLSQGALAADAEQGATLAKRWCATCHVVSTDQQSAGGQELWSKVGDGVDQEGGISWG